MLAFYDLARCPPTYDVVTFLSHAELERQRRGEDGIDIRILPGPRDGFRADRVWPQDVATRRAMLERIVVPMCEMLPSVRSVTVEGTRQGASGFGVGAYIIGLAKHVEALRAGCRPLRAYLDPILNPRLVTITLREAEHWPERNSRVGQWIIAARAIRKMGFDVVFVRDTLKAEEPIEDFAKDFSGASRYLPGRASLYRFAICNLFVSNGPAWFCVALDAPMLMLKPVTEIGATHDARYFARCGLPHGSQLPTSPVYQRIVWAEDNALEIERAFGAFMEAQPCRQAA